MVIDVHTHIFSRDICDDRESALADRQFRVIHEDRKSALVDHRALMESMRLSGIDRAVAMGFPWERDDLCAAQNEYFADVMRLSGGAVLPFGSVPVNGTADVEAWVRSIKEMGLAGVGEAGFYRDGMTPGNRRHLVRLLAAVQACGLPLCLHVNEPVGHRYPGKYDPDLGWLFETLAAAPGATIILSHWGGGLLFYELMPEVSKGLAHCYYDTAASPYLYSDEMYGTAAGIVGPGRILFGSDYPLLTHRRYLDSIDRAVPERGWKADILGMNAARLLDVR